MTSSMQNTSWHTVSRAGLTAVLAAVLVMTALATSPATGQEATGTSVTYTTEEDFDKGRLVNVSGANDELKLTQGGTFPFIWVALSARGTIAKIDTATGDILGEYRTAPDTISKNPSRTTVGLDGTVWAGNRGSGYVVHVGAVEANQCVDRDSSGTIETSTGYDDVLPWPTLGDPSAVSTAADECILHLVDHVGGDARSVSVNADGDVWVGSYTGTARTFQLIDGVTAEIKRTEGPFNCGGYGGVIDSNGVLWSASSGSSVLRWDPNAPIVADTNPRCIAQSNYGIALDNDGWVWVTTVSDVQNVYKISPDGNTILGPFPHGGTSSLAQGLAVDANNDVWVSSGLFCSSNCTVGHLKNDGTFVGNVPMGPDHQGSTGVAVDAAGKIWTANINSSTAMRIDPTAGALSTTPGLETVPIGEVDLGVEFPAGTTITQEGSPYNYSDMTGGLLLGGTAPQGSWTVVQDSGAADTRWGAVSWNATVPDGASLDAAFEVRAANTPAGLGGESFQEVGACDPIADAATGRYIEVRLTLRPNSAGESPLVHDVTIRTEEAVDELGCEAGEPGTGGDPGGGGGVVPGPNQFKTGDNATEDDPLVVQVLSPNPGPINVNVSDVNGAADATTEMLPISADITAPAATASNPIRITFRIHQSLLGEQDHDDVVVFRDGTSLPSCSSQTAATPDPCVASRTTQGDEVILEVLTSAASMWTFAVTVPQAPPLCGTDVPEGAFDDVPMDNVHRSAIDCAAHLGLTIGMNAASYGPASSTNRGQMATFIVRLLMDAGVDLPLGDDHFADDDGTTHEDNINRLAEAGIVQGRGPGTYATGMTVTREQMATYLTNAYEHATNTTLEAGDDQFDDIAGSVHRDSINKAARAGLAMGVQAGTYDPATPVRRDQMGSFVVRLLESLMG